MDALFASPNPNSTSELGDYVMMESCVDIDYRNDEMEIGGGTSRRWGKLELRREAARTEKKEYPPPLTMLAMTENQLPHMPFVMRRYYTDDGRLIIREERVRHHEYFKVTRSNGRLTLQLVPLDEEEEERESEEEGDDCNVEDFSNVHEDDNVVDEECEVSEKEVKFPREKVEIGGAAVVVGGGGGKCYDYMRVRSSPCLFGLTVPAIRPVHI